MNVRKMESIIIVLMDCQMPEMDGYEVSRVIRDPDSDVLNHNITTVALTANAMKGDRNACIEAGMDDYLAKPLRKASIEACLSKHLV